MAIDSWAKARVYGTWTDADGNRIEGRVEASISARLTSTVADVIVVPGKYAGATAPLNVVDLEAPAYEAMIPATDDSEIPQTGWAVFLKVSLDGGIVENYTLRDIPSGGSINLRDVLPDSGTRNVVTGVTALKLGIPGGVAMLNSDGYVTDAFGNAITSGGNTGGGDGGTNPSTTDYAALFNNQITEG